ncbi:unnamed protein product [Nezara viridula]|uniref:Protein kinase domain-containing protein n=1 Tax=Nezara viridula TaxID=85310 RepID=A0A9P0HQL1_NEZVI|nr:unnamed protein product [Nezara viridula]
MFGEPRSTTLTLVALGAGLLLYLPARPPTAPEQPPRSSGQHQLLNCTSLEEVTDLEWVASGWTKAVYRGRLRGRDIAVKTVNLDGHDIESCLARPEAPSLARCYRRTSAKILRELILLQELDHPNVIKVRVLALHS